MIKKLSLVLICLVAFMYSCASSGKAKKVKLYDCDGKTKEAISKYNKKNYSSAKTLIDEIKEKCTGHEVMDTILYYSGKSLIKMKRGLEAKSEFERLVQDFPGSKFHEEAAFLIGYCVYLESNPPDRDQSETKESIRLFQDFIDEFGGSVWVDSAKIYISKATEKLATKELKNAQFYQKLNEIDAAIVYYKSLIQAYPQSKQVHTAVLSVVQLLVQQNRTSEANDILDFYKEFEYKNIETEKKLQGLLSSSQSK